MLNNSHEPPALVSASATDGNPDPDGANLSTFDNDEDNDPPSRAERHDGWTGQRMAMFCALLAETGIVSDACHAVGMSRTTAYGARRRNPLFAAAWEESLAIARNRLADELLERSLTGSVEKFYRDGELVAEKRVVDNKLGMAILRRLDRMAETGLALHSNLVPAVRPQRSAPPPTAAKSPDWDLMLSALRTGDEDLMAEAMVELRAMESDEADKADNPPIQSRDTVNFDDEEEDAPRCWWDEDENCWMTDFPPRPASTATRKSAGAKKTISASARLRNAAPSRHGPKPGLPKNAPRTKPSATAGSLSWPRNPQRKALRAPRQTRPSFPE